MSCGPIPSPTALGAVGILQRRRLGLSLARRLERFRDRLPLHRAALVARRPFRLLTPPRKRRPRHLRHLPAEVALLLAALQGLSKQNRVAVAKSARAHRELFTGVQDWAAVSPQLQRLA